MAELTLWFITEFYWFQQGSAFHMNIKVQWYSASLPSPENAFCEKNSFSTFRQIGQLNVNKHKTTFNINMFFRGRDQSGCITVIWDLHKIRWTNLKSWRSLNSSPGFLRIPVGNLMWSPETQPPYFLGIKFLYVLLSCMGCFFPAPPHSRKANISFHISYKMKQK